MDKKETFNSCPYFEKNNIENSKFPKITVRDQFICTSNVELGQ